MEAYILLPMEKMTDTMMKTVVSLVVVALLTGCSPPPEPAPSTEGQSLVRPASTGNVGFLQGETARVAAMPLAPFVGGPFRNDLVHIRELPTDVVPDARGCFCFSPTDDRFAYAHTYFHATRALRHYNARLAELGLPPVQGVGISIQKAAPGMPTTGTTQGGGPDGSVWFEVTTSSPVVDTSIVVHELGHAIDIRLPRPAPPDGGQVPESPVPLESRELFANLLAALELRISRLAEFGWLDASIDLTRPLRYPDRILTEVDLFQSMINAPRFAAAFPDWVRGLEEALATDPDKYRSPDGYSNSALVVGPMLELARACGHHAAQRIALAARRQMSWRGDLGAFTPPLVAAARLHCPRASSRFEAALRERGVLSP